MNSSTPSQLSKLYSMHWGPFAPNEPLWDNVLSLDPDLLKDVKLLVASDMRVGIEVEVENYYARAKAANTDLFWGWKGDGSLRDAGIEFFSFPVYGKYIVAALNVLKRTLEVQRRNKHDAAVNFSDLCGLHIHLNIRDFSYEQFACLSFLYTIWEESLFRVSGARDQSIYCVPIKIAGPLLRGLFVPLLKGNSPELGVRNLVAPATNYKYAALNFRPVRNFGTVEFRHAKGTGDTKEIISWINLILLLGEGAKKYKFQQLVEDVFSLNTNSEYVKFTRKIFKNHSNALEWTNLESEMSEGVSKLKAWCIDVDKIYVDDSQKRSIPKLKHPSLPSLKDVIFKQEFHNVPVQGLVEPMRDGDAPFLDQDGGLVVNFGELNRR